MNAPLSIKTADLFCGGGGWSEGLRSASEELGIDIKSHICVNHWGPAINTHSSNHKYAKHICDKLNTLNPSKYGKLDALIAAPECTHFSNARGSAPINDQKRIPAGSVTEWIEKCQPSFFAIENVREFENWGPVELTCKLCKHHELEVELPECPKCEAKGNDVECIQIKGREGELFQSNIVEPIKILGYSIEWKILNCADYGDPTTRQRLFILGRRDGKPVEWPQSTHSKDGANGLYHWIPARDIIDWSLKSKSIFDRKKPLAKNTLKRIEAGIKKFWGPWAEPFLIVLKGGTEAHRNASSKSLDEPVPTICANGLHVGLVEPLLIGQQSGGAARPTTDPLMTASTKGAIGIAEGFLVEQSFRGARDNLVKSIDQPVPTCLTKQHICLCQPVILQNEHGGREYPSDRPVPAITANGRGFSMIEPFVTIARGKSTARSTSDPTPTLTTGEHLSLCEPFILQYYSEGSGKQGHSIKKPLPTVTCKDRFGVVQQFGLDIHYRMLQPHELAAAMGFPKNYLWYGNKTQTVRQIGNAVPVNTAKAILKTLLEQTVYSQ
jgi:DNA (cytosine-5)-methyltransferase 1